MRLKLNRVFFVKIILILILAIFFVTPYFYRMTNSFVSVLAYPFLTFQSYCINPLKYYFSSKANISKEYDCLKNEYNDLIQKYVELEVANNFKLETLCPPGLCPDLF